MKETQCVCCTIAVSVVSHVQGCMRNKVVHNLVQVKGNLDDEYL